MSRNKRLQKQMFDLQSNDTPQQIELLKLHPQLESATFAFTGPINSPYEGYWFRIFVSWTQDYPLRPPSIKLVDKIWNPYADFENNSICVDILQDQYSPSLTTSKIILSIISLFGESKIEDNHNGFANPKAASQMMNNYPFFCEQTKKICQSHSFKRKQLYKDCQRGIAEEHYIKAEGKELEKLIEKQQKSPRMLKNTNNKKAKQMKLSQCFKKQKKNASVINSNEDIVQSSVYEQKMVWSYEKYKQEMEKKEQFISLLSDCTLKEKEKKQDQ